MNAWDCVVAVFGLWQLIKVADSKLSNITAVQMRSSEDCYEFPGPPLSFPPSPSPCQSSSPFSSPPACWPCCGGAATRPPDGTSFQSINVETWLWQPSWLQWSPGVLWGVQAPVRCDGGEVWHLWGPCRCLATTTRGEIGRGDWSGPACCVQAPGGRFANGLITRQYKPGQDIVVKVDVTANHKGFFTFKLCSNNNTAQDPTQQCFDK